MLAVPDERTKSQTARDGPESKEPTAAAGSLVSKRHPNHRHVKIHRSCTVEEIANLVTVHKNTVRGWVNAGLPTTDDKRPMLIRGHELIAFLKARRVRNKQTCQPGEMYCVRCPPGNFLRVTWQNMYLSPRRLETY